MFACEFCPCVFTKQSSANRHCAKMHPEKDNSPEQTGFNDDEDDDSVNVARVMEQMKSFQESMGIMDMKPAALELSLMKPPSPGPRVSTVTIVDTINPNKEKNFKKVKEIIYRGQRTIACIYCDKPFKRQHDLLRHHWIHTQEKPYECSVFNKNFTRSSGLKLHQNIHSSSEKPSRVYECAADECNKRFSSVRALDTHTKTHSSSISYICPICSKVFTSKGGFSSHKHHEKDEEFDLIRPFLKHEATHSGEKPLKCGTCFRTYTTQSSLNQHLKIHAAEKPHICEICNAKFITKSLLARHMISHSDERNFACHQQRTTFMSSQRNSFTIITKFLDFF